MTDEDDILLSECGTCTQPFKTQLHRQEEFSRFLSAFNSVGIVLETNSDLS